MEAKRIAVMIQSFVLIFGLLLGQSGAEFGFCFTGCFDPCVKKPDENVGSCFFKCVWDCLTKISALDHCKLGCAFSSCKNFSTKDDSGVGKVEKCVDSCQGLCSQGYSLHL